MATGNEKLTFDITAKDDASKVIDSLLKDVEKLENSDPTIDVDANVKDVLGAFDQVIAETKDVQVAADRLAQALGPELAAKADPTAVVGQLREMGLTLDQIKGNADELGAKMREAADTDVGGRLGSSLGTARGKIDEMTGSARGANSALANMVGNSAQDLGALGGIAGSTGVAIGQMAEYASDAALAGEGLGSSLRSMTAVAGPIAAMTVGVAILSKAMQGFADRAKRAAELRAFRDQEVKEYAKAVKDGSTVVDVLNKRLADTDELMSQIGFNAKGWRIAWKNMDISDVMARNGVSTKLFGEAIQDGAPGIERLRKAMEAAGVSSQDMTTIISAAESEWAAYARGAEIAAKSALLQSGASQEVIRSAALSAEAMRLEGQAAQYAADQALEEAQAHESLAARIEASAAEQEIANSTTEEASDFIDRVNDKLQEHVDKLQADAEALNKQSDAMTNSADDQIAYNDALDDFNAKAADAEASTDDVRDAAISAAKAHAELYTSLTEASGATATSTGKLDALNSSLLQSARTATPEAQREIIKYIAAVNGISEEKATEIVANADTDQAAADLAAVSANRATTVQADADLSTANSQMSNFINQKRTVTLTPILAGSKFAKGGDVGPDGGVAGETGKPEILTRNGQSAIVSGAFPVTQGTHVTGVDETARILAAASADGQAAAVGVSGGGGVGGGTVNNFYFKVPPFSDPIRFAETQAQLYKRGGGR